MGRLEFGVKFKKTPFNVRPISINTTLGFSVMRNKTLVFMDLSVVMEETIVQIPLLNPKHLGTLGRFQRIPMKRSIIFVMQDPNVRRITRRGIIKHIIILQSFEF